MHLEKKTTNEPHLVELRVFWLSCSYSNSVSFNTTINKASEPQRSKEGNCAQEQKECLKEIKLRFAEMLMLNVFYVANDADIAKILDSLQEPSHLRSFEIEEKSVKKNKESS